MSDYSWAGFDKKRIIPKLERIDRLMKRAVYSDKHNVIIIWGELGFGKTTAALQILYKWLQDWTKVLSFILNPHVCEKCEYEWEIENPWIYEVPCPKCNQETITLDPNEARQAVFDKKFVIPHPFDYNTGLPIHFPSGTEFSINTSKARGKIVQRYPYLNFSFNELSTVIKTCVELRLRLPVIVWDDVAVYFHRSNIQYMHPDVKNFFSRYNFVRKYVGNLVITVPTLEFVPEQLSQFMTADIMVTDTGHADFDIKKPMRSFYGRNKVYYKSYDGKNVTWQKAPNDWFGAYEEIRHAHAVEAFEHPEEIMVTTMPKAKEFTEEESVFDQD